MADWVTRPAGPEHESGLVYMWLEGAKRCRQGRAHSTGRTYWTSHVPIVEYLLRTDAAQTTVAGLAGVPDSILAFACTSGPTVHMVAVHRDWVRAGVGTDLLSAVLSPEQMRGPTPYTFEVPRMSDGTGTTVWRPPRSWYSDPTWFGRHFIGIQQEQAA